MQQVRFLFRLALVPLLFSACSVSRRSGGDDQKISVQFIQVNDVYEIAPLSGGREGGVARVATLKKEALRSNTNTYMVMAGDFLSPSVYNSLLYNGKAVRGKQMVEALNAAGLDFAVFGNHEFDIRESELQERLEESRFQWISSNVLHHTKEGARPFYKEGKPIPRTYTLRVRDADGTTARIGIISVTLPFNKADYVRYQDPLTTAQEQYNALKDSVDAVVAFTHQLIEEDRKLAKALPGLAFIMGGHEHDMRFVKEGKVYITKAHANAKSAYVLDLKVDQKRKKVDVAPRLVYLNEQVALDSAANAVVEKWSNIAEKNFSTLGFNARRVVMSSGEGLDGREASVRTQSTNLTRIIVRALERAAPQADVVLMNSGSIRVDDVLSMPVTEYDIIRTLPFGGGLREAEVKGSLLLETLEKSEANKGIGGYLQYSESLTRDGNVWKLKGAPVEQEKVYRIALTDFLFTGKEANLGFLQPSDPRVVKAYEPPTAANKEMYDIRQAVILYLDSLK